jgi:hypothetical protein
MIFHVQLLAVALALGILRDGVAAIPVAGVALAGRDVAALYANVGNYSYFGCFVETYQSLWRTLGTKSTSYKGMTLETCAKDCAGYTFFGTQYGQEASQIT